VFGTMKRLLPVKRQAFGCFNTMAPANTGAIDIFLARCDMRVYNCDRKEGREYRYDEQL